MLHLVMDWIEIVFASLLAVKSINYLHKSYLQNLAFKLL
jgi:uncharacterized membrane protein YebE (DUF533 family)